MLWDRDIRAGRLGSDFASPSFLPMPPSSIFPTGDMRLPIRGSRCGRPSREAHASIYTRSVCACPDALLVVRRRFRWHSVPRLKVRPVFLSPQGQTQSMRHIRYCVRAPDNRVAPEFCLSPPTVRSILCCHGRRRLSLPPSCAGHRGLCGTGSYICICGVSKQRQVRGSIRFANSCADAPRALRRG